MAAPVSVHLNAMHDHQCSLSGTITFNGEKYKIVDCGILHGKAYAIVEPKCPELEDEIRKDIADRPGIPDIDDKEEDGLLIELNGRKYPYEMPES